AERRGAGRRGGRARGGPAVRGGGRPSGWAARLACGAAARAGSGAGGVLGLPRAERAEGRPREASRRGCLAGPVATFAGSPWAGRDAEAGSAAAGAGLAPPAVRVPAEAARAGAQTPAVAPAPAADPGAGPGVRPRGVSRAGSAWAGWGTSPPLSPGESPQLLSLSFPFRKNEGAGVFAGEPRRAQASGLVQSSCTRGWER
ncbi:PREDICTED: protein FAM71B-like, partial [Chinchilla lanigera]|uniref:protein FAM71B-like n=1 Tax=Chinchilla lanigera TaxID=34839 RepID=UPI000698EE74